MHEIADMFLDYEEEELLSGMTSTQAVKLIININGLLQVCTGCLPLTDFFIIALVNKYIIVSMIVVIMAIF